uniref:DOMON domain-containing protein n=1 Tax=Megaselia scalaris TaxID=36166 RepID=T1H054_MEGSC
MNWKKEIILLIYCLPIIHTLLTHKHIKDTHNFESEGNDENRQQHFEIMDGNGLYILEWWIQEKDINFRVTVNTQGSIALGFSKKIGMLMDFLLIWVDDHSGKPHILSRPIETGGTPLRKSIY